MVDLAVSSAPISVPLFELVLTPKLLPPLWCYRKKAIAHRSSVTLIGILIIIVTITLTATLIHSVYSNASKLY